MLGIEDLAAISQLVLQLLVDVQLVFDPQRAGKQERAKPARHHPQIRLEDPLELEQRLVVEAHGGKIRHADPRRRQAVVHRTPRKIRITLLAGQALLGDGGNDLAVAQQTGRTVVIKGRDSEYVFRLHSSVIPQYESTILRCKNETGRDEARHDAERSRRSSTSQPLKYS